MKKFSVRFLLSFVLLFLSLQVLATGKVRYTKGSVTVQNKPLKKGDLVNVGSRIKTGPNSLVIIKFQSGSTLKINENSSLIVEYPGDPNKVSKPSSFHLLKGSSFFNKDPKSKTPMRVKAHSVAMGVRGTTFFVSFGKKKPEDVYMCVQKGKVLIKGSQQKKVTLVKEGEGVVVPNGLTSSAPKPLPWTKNLNWKLDPSEKDLENNVTIEESYSDPLSRDYD